MGLLQVISRVGAATAPWVAQWLRHVHKTLPFLLMGGLTIIASFLCFVLKETKGKETAELLNTVKPIEGMNLFARWQLQTVTLLFTANHEFWLHPLFST